MIILIILLTLTINIQITIHPLSTDGAIVIYAITYSESKYSVELLSGADISVTACHIPIKLYTLTLYVKCEVVIQRFENWTC